MHITLEADYAVRIVHCLAKSGRRMDAKSIAEPANSFTKSHCGTSLFPARHFRPRPCYVHLYSRARHNRSVGPFDFLFKYTIFFLHLAVFVLFFV